MYFFYWQDVPTPQTPVFQKYGRLEVSTSLSSRISKSDYADPHINDLTTVGHLHEIAEEIEIFEESSVEDEDPLNISSEISSFGKFLIIAAQRQPKSTGLTRVLSATATSG